MSNEFKRGAVSIAQRMVKELIVENWRDIYAGTRRIHLFDKVAKFPATSVRGMELSFSLDYITAKFGGEVYTISFHINRKTLKAEDFVFSTNWNSMPELLAGVHTTLSRHLLALARFGVA